MRLIVLGGTGFIGRRIVDELSRNDHDLTVVHRGVEEIDSVPGVRHIHGPRAAFAELWPQIREQHPDGLIDVTAYSRDDANAILEVTEDGQRLIVLSSMDVYRASGALRGQEGSGGTQFDETSPLREERYIYRDADHPDDDYEKLDVEEAYLQRGGSVLRLPMVYGEHDRQRREEFILRRVRAGRAQIPIGVGNLVWSRGYVGDVATAARLLMEAAVEREIFNVCESQTWTIRQWAERIAATAGWTGEFVTVQDEMLPSDLRLTRTYKQHLQFDAGKARRELGWRDTDPTEALQATVRWHLENPPTPNEDFGSDDRALSQQSGD